MHKCLKAFSTTVLVDPFHSPDVVVSFDTFLPGVTSSS